MKISEVGEFALIDHIAASFKELLPPNLTGIGDDCALIPKNENTSYVVSSDMLVEDHHFYRNKISAYELGFKSLAVNLSDIAAMGASPVASFLSVGLPPDIETSWFEGFIKGYRELAGFAQMPLCGGDTVASEKIIINVTVMGEGFNTLLKLRSMARPGDLICCTMQLGDSAGGFRLLRENIKGDIGKTEKFLLERHNKPFPELAVGKWLSAQNGVRAMIDISDGLVADLRQILRASGGIAACLNKEAIPISDQLQRASEIYDWDSLDLALNGGEDYCLLLTVGESEASNITKRFLEAFGRPLYIIGEIESGKGQIRLLENGTETTFSEKGFAHF